MMKFKPRKAWAIVNNKDGYIVSSGSDAMPNLYGTKEKAKLNMPSFIGGRSFRIVRVQITEAKP